MSEEKKPNTHEHMYIVLVHVLVNGPLSMKELETDPPTRLTGDEVRKAVQLLSEQGFVKTNDKLKIEFDKNHKKMTSRESK